MTTTNNWYLDGVLEQKKDKSKSEENLNKILSLVNTSISIGSLTLTNVHTNIRH